MAEAMLELGNIQAGVLRPRPTPYAATYLGARIDDPAGGRELLKRLIPTLTSAADVTSPLGDATVSVALSYHGLKALGVPEASLAGFSPEFKQGMAARATALGDVGQSAPEHWERPLGTSDLHLMVAVVAPDRAHLETLADPAKRAYNEMHGKVTSIYRQDCYALPTEHEPFGFRDGINNPPIEGSGISGTNPQECPLKAGEFVLGYLDEAGHVPPIPQPEVLGRNGSYVVYRKLYQDVAAFRRYLAQNSTSVAEQELCAAKMMGRWRSGAPLALCPAHDNPGLGADPTRNNDFLYHDDPEGFKTPLGSHARRMNPRDHFKDGPTQVHRHRMIRRGTVYGPELAEGILEDDGIDRGIIFVCLGANLNRQFEFVQSEWVNQGIFIGVSNEKDPVTGPNDGTDVFTIPKQPIRRRLKGLSQFVINRGGEYFFLPGLPALRWLADHKM